MEAINTLLEAGKNNFIFLGGAGSGKSEIAVNFAEYLLELKRKEIHFFDMDMTKPLFRSRDLCNRLEAEGIQVHYEEQFMDAPTLVGGVRELLRREDCYVVMDVGGDHIGARSIGGFMTGTCHQDTVIYYVLNAFRPWSGDITHIDETLGAILGAAHLKVDEMHLINNPNYGWNTTTEEIVEGYRFMEKIVAPYKPIDFACVREELYEEAKNAIHKELLPLHLHLKYPWISDNPGGVS